MNIADLHKIDVADLKKVDFGQFLSNFEKNQNLVVRIILVIISLFLILRFIIIGQTEMGGIKTKIQKSEQKIELINKHNKAVQDYDEFFKKLPTGIPSSQIINKLTDFAETRDILILNFSLSATKQTEFYELGSISLKVVAPSYAGLVFFLKDIENSPDNLRIDNLVTSVDKSENDFYQNSDSPESLTEKIQAQMDVSSIKFKKNDKKKI